MNEAKRQLGKSEGHIRSDIATTVFIQITTVQRRVAKNVIKQINVVAFRFIGVQRGNVAVDDTDGGLRSGVNEFHVTGTK